MNVPALYRFLAKSTSCARWLCLVGILVMLSTGLQLITWWILVRVLNELSQREIEVRNHLLGERLSAAALSDSSQAT